MNRGFDRSELAFFQVPRTWKEIEARFGFEAKTEEFRNAVIRADDEGGDGWLHYLYPAGQWVLTDTGKTHVGKAILARELRVYPDARSGLQPEKKVDEAAMRDLFNALLESTGLFESSGAQKCLAKGANCPDCGLKMEQEAGFCLACYPVE
jgi:hypothetical protein